MKTLLTSLKNGWEFYFHIKLKPSTFTQVYSTIMWVPSEDMRLGRVEAGNKGPWWGKEDEEELKEEWDE